MQMSDIWICNTYPNFLLFPLRSDFRWVRICFSPAGAQRPGNTRYSGVISKISAVCCVTPLPRDRPLTTGKPRFAYSLTVVHFRKLRYK